jgi:hypothetical protein
LLTAVCYNSGMGGGVAVFGYAHIARYSPKPARAARFALFRYSDLHQRQLTVIHLTRCLPAGME